MTPKQVLASTPSSSPRMISDISAGQVSMKYGFHGPNYSTASACASSTNALIDACHLIRLGKADVIITGGAEASICAAGVGGFNAMNAPLHSQWTTLRVLRALQRFA